MHGGSDHPVGAPHGLADALRHGRELARLSGRDLAARAGVSQAAVSRAESGRDVGHATLQRLVDAMPSLDARALLGRPLEGGRPASGRLWRFFERLHGLRAREVVLEARVAADGRLRTQLDIRGLTSRHAGLDDPTCRAAVMGGIMVGSPEAASRLHPDRVGGRRRVHEICDERVTHRFELAADPRADGLDYRRTERGATRPPESEMPFAAPLGRPFARGTSLRLTCAAERLVLRVRFSARPPRAVRIEAWPAGLGTDPAVPLNRWSALYPHAPRWILVDVDGIAELQVERALPHACYGLSWDDDEPVTLRAARSPARVSFRRRPPLATVLRGAREEAGLSRRELARRLGCSPSSVMALEEGREPRASTLSTYLRELPHLSAFELLSSSTARGVATADETWEWSRDFFGMEVEEEVRTCVFSRDGTVRGEFRTESLTWNPTAQRDLLIRHDPALLPTWSEWELDSLSAAPSGGADEPRVRVVRRGAGRVVHEYRFQARGERPVVSLTRRSTIRGQFAMTMRRAESGAYGDQASRWPVLRGDASGRRAESIYVAPVTPARRLRLEVRFPRGYWPDAPRARVVSDCLLASEALADLQAQAHPQGIGFRVDETARTLHLDVARPLVGLRYALSWLIP